MPLLKFLRVPLPFSFGDATRTGSEVWTRREPPSLREASANAQRLVEKTPTSSPRQS